MIKNKNYKCKKCGGKRFFGKYADNPSCIDCGTFYKKQENE